MLPLFERASQFSANTSIISEGNSYSYEDLLGASGHVAKALLGDSTDLAGVRVAYMVTPGFDYVKVQWGIWMAGGIAVPLNPGNPFESIDYVIKDAGVGIVIYSKRYQDIFASYVKSAKLRLCEVPHGSESLAELPLIEESRPALILYTSGTTGSPKGVVTTHANIQAQIMTLVDAWQWSEKDQIINILPLHHVHGIINVVSCALWSGAACRFIPKFDARKVFEALSLKEVTLFMAVPTIYYKLVSYWEILPEGEQRNIRAALEQKRLMVSGSAALPISIMEKWKAISGHDLLERYGMTELGMAISNPYEGERRPGHIGQALPGVSVRLVDEQGEIVEEGKQGEIQVQGANVFKEYWDRPEATAESFTKDGWFKTGDIAKYHDGAYKILGRNSVDIIKSGGYKISALEIEEVLRTHPLIKDCGVVGIPDEEWGEIIGAGLVGVDKVDTQELTLWIKEKLPKYKIPRKYIMLEDLPRNAMGKVTKKDLVNLF